MRGFRHPFLSLAFLGTILSPICAAEPAFKTPDGLSVLRAAGPPQIRFPMFAALDDDGALYVAESSGLDLYAELQNQTRKCRISRLNDGDGDGVFEHAEVFADRLVFPMGLVWHRDALYAADPPDLVVLKDTDGDGRSDERKVLLSGFGHSDNGSLHGLIFGPDGWLYMTLGQPDGYKLKRADGTLLEGKSGALLRCRADGSDVELVARGFENLVEIEFLPTGEIIGTDNWFTLPQAGTRDALVHVLEGGVYPLNAHARTERHHFQSGSLLPALALYPAVALSGITRYRGDQFSGFRDTLFTAQFNARKVVTHRLQRIGATFRTTDEDFLITDDPDFHPSDVLEDIDGSLLVVDTGAWYVHHCPTGRIRKSPAQGAIYRIFRGEQIGKTGQRLRRGKTSSNEPTTPTPSTLAALASTDPNLAAQAARMLGRLGQVEAQGSLVQLLSHPETHVKLAAAEALVRCGSSNSVGPLTAALADTRDPLMEHAILFALFRLANRTELTALLEHPSARVQHVGLTLLDQAPHHSLDAGIVLRRVGASDEQLRRTALTILQRHPEWGASAEPFIRSLLDRSDLDAAEQNALRDLIVAFQSNPAVQALVAQGMSAPNQAARSILLLDGISRSTLAQLPSAWLTGIGQALTSENVDVCRAAIRTSELRRLDKFDGVLREIAGRTNLPAEVRFKALRNVLIRQPRLTPPTFRFLLTEIAGASAVAARLEAVELLGRTRWADAENDPVELLAIIRDDRLISTSTLLPLLLQSQGRAKTATMNYLATALARGWQPTEKQSRSIREWLAGGTGAEGSQLVAKLTERAIIQQEELETYMELLSGGNADRGRRWFSEKAGCIACHRVDGQGGFLGPDLTRIGLIRAGRDLVESLVQPSASFAQGYETLTVRLRNDEELTGVRVRQEDESFALRESSGREVRLAADQIHSVERQQLSLMPEGLLAALSRDEIRDLLAYLQSLK